MAFEPTLVGTKWLCPCKDAYGRAAELLPSWPNGNPEQAGETTITNFNCDQNSDRWQQITRGDEVTWHYLGRRSEVSA